MLCHYIHSLYFLFWYHYLLFTSSLVLHAMQWISSNLLKNSAYHVVWTDIRVILINCRSRKQGNCSNRHTVKPIIHANREGKLCVICLFTDVVVLLSVINKVLPAKSVVSVSDQLYSNVCSIVLWGWCSNVKLHVCIFVRICSVPCTFCKGQCNLSKKGAL